MLTSLHIENFAIVSFLQLDFQNGMTTFTGETGAGKSIMIDALTLALGGRGDATVIRAGAEKCDISAVFLFEKNSAPALWLEAHELDASAQEIILRRVIQSEGRSKSFINGMPFPLQKVKELAETLVDIHGQHQHQSLLNHATHRLQLDQYADHPHLLAEVNEYYRESQKLVQQIEALKQQTNTEEKQALLHYQLEELSKLEVKENEMQQLHEEHHLLHHAREYLSNCETITQLLQAEEGRSVMQYLNQAQQLLQQLPSSSQVNLKNAIELINTAIIQCEEAKDEVESFARQVELDPEKLQTIEERMSALHLLARKYHIDANQLADYQKKLEDELHHLQSTTVQLKQLQDDYESTLLKYHSASLTLRASRTQAATLLSQEISQTMQKLGMPKGYLQIEITPLEKINAHGMDKVEYKVCTNPGMLPDSLGKIASGGELSRISLAIQLIAAQRGATPTLLFDEVDVGIGGATAALVGQYLRKLGERLQLFCVTHQPQVASSAHSHFFVEKFTQDDCTFSKVKCLTKEERVHEIARMLGGLTITEQTVLHAKELLQQSHISAQKELI